MPRVVRPESGITKPGPRRASSSSKPRAAKSSCTRCAYAQRNTQTGQKLVGREILFCWKDETWYSVIVVAYYPVDDEYKIVYRVDDGLETTTLEPGRFLVIPQKRRIYNNLILEGAIIEFTYPGDGMRHQAMIYDYAQNGTRLKIAYLNEDHTDILKGGGWEFVTQSPCIDYSVKEQAGE